MLRGLTSGESEFRKLFTSCNSRLVMAGLHQSLTHCFCKSCRLLHIEVARPFTRPYTFLRDLIPFMRPYSFLQDQPLALMVAVLNWMDSLVESFLLEPNL